MIRARALSSLAACALVLAACSSKSSSPSNASFALTFPSTAAAIATDEVEVLAFDLGDASVGDICPALVELRRNTQDLPATIASTPFLPPCSFASGKGAFTVPYGIHALLAIGQKSGNDLLIGCAVEDIEGDGATVGIDLTLISDTVSIPSTTCTSLSSFCAASCM